MGEPEAAAARRAILSGWVTQGPEVEAFEAEFAAYVGAPHACAVSSGTAALHLALLAVGVRPGDEVVTVSHSFIATANVVHHCGATPVFVDIEPGTFNIDPALVEAAIGPRTRAVLCVHQIGLPCDLRQVLAIARRRGVAVVEDAACAVGAEIDVDGSGRWERIGRPHGDVACFSFHPRKLVSTGDGGMITTRDPAIDRFARLARHHGMDTSDRARHESATVAVEAYALVGYNYRMTDIQAAVGREQLARLPEMVARRRELAAEYGRRLAAIAGLGLPVEPSWARSNFQSYAVRLPDGCGQRAVMQHMLDAGVSTRRGVMCAHREPAYATAAWACTPGAADGAAPAARACDCGPGACRRLRESERAQDRCLLLPLFHELTGADQHEVAAALARAVAAGRTSDARPVPTDRDA
ncbi:MAG: DegT/DnrJ/EryC1/StrS family aminotransferase [Vicinamibacterales bacterium]